MMARKKAPKCPAQIPYRPFYGESSSGHVPGLQTFDGHLEKDPLFTHNIKPAAVAQLGTGGQHMFNAELFPTGESIDRNVLLSCKWKLARRKKASRMDFYIILIFGLDETKLSSDRSRHFFLVTWLNFADFEPRDWMRVLGLMSHSMLPKF